MNDQVSVGAILGMVTLLAGGVGVWVTLRERLVRAETKIEVLERQHNDHKSEVQSLREYLDTQFGELRKVLALKADR